MNQLRVRLLLWVLVPMTLVLALMAVVSWQNARRTALLVQDRRLLASAEVMAGQVRWQQDRLSAETPPAALQMFASRERDRVYFQVRSASGEVLAGWPDLTKSGQTAEDTPRYSTIEYHGDTVRMVTLTRHLYRGGITSAVLVSVAESRHAYHHLLKALWQPVLVQESALLALALALMVIGLTLELKPLLHLRRDLQARETDDFRPLGTMQLQRELRPIVDTINQYAMRLTAQVSIQKRFIADAAHQMRTPVAIMSTQLDYAAHLTQDPELSETLRAVRASARRQKDLINQLLSLSHAESSRAANLPRKKVNLLDMAQEVLVALSVPADDKEMDLGLSATSAEVAIWTFPTLVHAIAFNLVDNAIRYTPRGGHVTVHVGPDKDGGAVLRVDDSGPGIADSLKARVFERFSRGNMSDNEGFGLGLAIVGEAAKTCGAQIELVTPPAGGLSVIVRLPFDEH